MPTLKRDYLVKKKNVLNEIRSTNMTLQELRFLSIYLSKINPNDVDTRVVRFSLSDFKAIMDFESRIKIDYMKNVTDSLLSKVVSVPITRGGYTSFQLFKKCTVSVDDAGEWYVEIDAHDDMLPHMFEFKNKYFSYQLFNALRLRSSNQLRMYEILKQYEKIGSRVLSVEELKELLGIEKSEYTLFNNFKKWVLDACQQALKEHTDIKFSYEPYGKKGKGGKILFLKFIIEKNSNYVDQLTLEMFIDENREMDTDEPTIHDERINFLSEACNDEFSINEIIVLYNLMIECLPYSTIRNDIKCYDFLKHKYDYMIMRNEKESIKNRFAYMKKIISSEI